MRVAPVLAALALGAALAARATAQPASSSDRCASSDCDCRCIAAEQQKGRAEIRNLAPPLPLLVDFQLTDDMPPLQSLAILQDMAQILDRMAFMEEYKESGLAPRPDSKSFWNLNEEYWRRRWIVPSPPDGEWDSLYLRTVADECRKSISYLEKYAERQRAIEFGLTDCAMWANRKQCGALEAPPPEASPSPATSPPREPASADGPLPIGRHADGRPYMNDELVSRYVAASQAKVREGGAYWRRGRMGQADYAEIDSRAREWFRYRDLPDERLQRFDNAEIETLTRRSVEVTKAYNEDW